MQARIRFFESVKTLARRYKAEADASSMTTVSVIDGRPSITFIADLIEAEARARGMASALNMSRLGVNLYQRSLGQDQRCFVHWCSARVKGGGAELSKVEASWFTPSAGSVLAWNLAASDFQERLAGAKG